MRRSFDANGEQQVSAPQIYGFEIVDAHRVPKVRMSAGINRKFTSNQMSRIFSGFSPSLPQCKYFRFIDGC
jgi:hypothetical protein